MSWEDVIGWALLMVLLGVPGAAYVFLKWRHRRRPGTVGGEMGRVVPLEDEERVLYEAFAKWRNATWLGSGIGMLYLTSQRLIWARERLPFPLGVPLPSQPVLMIPLTDILETNFKILMFGSRYSLIVRTRQRTYRFMFIPISEEEDVKECRDMIEKARRSHEIPS